MKIYNLLVNRHSGIADRYHRLHDNSRTALKWISYFYLLFLNFCYYVLFCRFLGQPEEEKIYEEKRLIIDKTESEMRIREGLSVEETVEILAGYDVVSFDIFDTLIFRPFDDPTALFFLLGERLGFMDFRRIRIEAEQEARQKNYKKTGSYEVTLEDIWSRLEEKTGLPAKTGMKLEMELERCYCYANPFMLQVFHRLTNMGKRIIITSDMYLSREFLQSLLEEKGFAGAEKIYISNEWGGSKYSGRLYDFILQDLDAGRKQIVHIGDNRRSDIEMAKKHGLVPLLYPNVNKKAMLFRSHDMSPIVGSAYRGLVDSHLYCGLETFSPEYEYGYIYGGLFVVGYCSFIHEYCRLHQTDKVLFLSRDGDILSQVYRMLYPDENTEYVYWSRKAALKLMASSDRYDYFRRFLHHKVNQKISLEKIFQSMELESLLDDLPTQTGAGALHKSDYLTSGNLAETESFLTAEWDRVLACYREEHEAAAVYYGKVLKDCRKAVAVDIGWAGSGAVALKTLVEKVWKLPCSITGIIAGTNTLHNAEPFAGETFLQTGELVAYMYSLSHNRDLVKKHNPNKNYNVYWELLLSSPTRQFTGFGLRRDKAGIRNDYGRGDESVTVNDAIELHFGKSDENQNGIREIQRGILDFAGQYLEHFGNMPYMFHISGRDAYAPMLAAASRKEKYLKAMEKRFAPDIQVN
ncbi:MAG: HAD-IA family hydrolase [Butyrivibrio sp.]|nr:HAD-IA family hydrolase [Acetatifactor muris]MCM1559365.1 HAD-IA family hydrolase [Butyrivibrio sp.]